MNYFQRKLIFILYFLISIHYTYSENSNNNLKVINNKYVNSQFGWQIQSDSKKIMQSAYQIEIYSKLPRKIEKIWDSGRVI